MIEGCKHGPSDLIPQPCADCEQERLSGARATHAVAERLSRLARVGREESEDAPADPLSGVRPLGDLGTENVTTEVGEWKVLRDPARPNWPGVLVVPSDNSSLVHVEAGRPVNFADSVALAERLVEALRVAPVSEAGEARSIKEKR